MERNGISLVNYPIRPYVVYNIRSEDKEDLSIYVGVTRDYTQRAYQHSKNRKYDAFKSNPLYIWMNDVIDNKGLKVEMEIVEEGYTEEEAYNREKELIILFKYDKFNVLNISSGGKGNFGNIPWNKNKKNPYSVEQLERLSTSHIGSRKGEKRTPHTQEAKDLIKLRNKERKERGWQNPRKKKVYKYTLDGKLVKVYSCMDEAAEAEHISSTSICAYCRKKYRHRSNNFNWSYEEL